MHANANPKWAPAAANSGGIYSGSEDDLDVGAAPAVQGEVQEHLHAGGEGSRSAIHAPGVPPLMRAT